MTAAATMTPEQVASYDPAVWAIGNSIKVQGGPFSLAGREYQAEPLQSDVKRRAYLKATGGGFSNLEMIRNLHRLIHGYYSQGVMYLFPTADDMHDFSNSRFRPLLLDNPETLGRFLSDTDTAGLKRIGDSFLYMRGATVTHRVEDQADASKLRGIQVDAVVFDEYDLMDPEIEAQALGRMGASIHQHEVYISNPSMPGFGIDVKFRKGDQRRWHRRCGCGVWTCPDLEFPNLIRRGGDGKGFIACKKCGKPTSMYPGEWVAAERANLDTWGISWQWSHLNSRFHDPADVLDLYADPPNGDLAGVYKWHLGLPYVASEDALTEAMVLECCGSDAPAQQAVGPCAMGVDVGKMKHVVIGVRTGREAYEIIKMARVETFSDAHDLARRFNVKSAVIDARPYEDEARAFQRAERFRVFLCEYSESTVQAPDYNEKSGMVKCNRTEACDATHRMMAERRVRFPRRDHPETKLFAEHCAAIAKVLETNKRTGGQTYRYRARTGKEDHYRHALNYFLLAAKELPRIKSKFEQNIPDERAESAYNLFGSLT